jgi:uncharacterized protein YndB with AHSA1/START domain
MSYELRMERLFGAPPEIVFDAFVDPDAQGQLYADDEGDPSWGVESELDLRVGGTWTIAFGKAGEEPFRETNVFELVDRPHRLVYTSTLTESDGSSIETRMDVSFKEENGRTRMTIVHSGFPTSEMRDKFAEGWPSVLEALERVVAARVVK